MNNKIFEWTGVTTAILYSLFVALNIGIEFIGFSLLLLSAALIGIWAYRGKHKGILLLQFFYASAGVIGMIRWFWLKNEKTFSNRGSGFVKEKKEYFMSLDWNLIWIILQVSALLIIAREIDKRIRKIKKWVYGVALSVALLVFH